MPGNSVNPPAGGPTGRQQFNLRAIIRDLGLFILKGIAETSTMRPSSSGVRRWSKAVKRTPTSWPVDLVDMDR